MSKSNYPNKLDTSVEIPVVRDNITEIGSDVLNSLRDAIFSIERTLGINPQGQAGNTLASRLGNIIDDNGNLKEEALTRAGILGGPISDKDVSKVAAIKEFKLDLDFPTSLLQDEVSILNNKIEGFVGALEELNRIISVHVTPEAIDRHKAIAITVESNSVSPSDVSLKDISSGDLQSFIVSLFDSHIYYSGANIGIGNNSHNANQVFFDNANSSDIIFSSDVQGAIDDLSNIEGEGIRSSILNLNSNGRIRSGSVIDGFEGNDSNSIIIDFTEISYSDYIGESKTTINFTSLPTPLFEIREFDILEISDSTNLDDNGDYIISSHTLGIDGSLGTVTVFDGPKSSLSTGTIGRVRRTGYSGYNQN